MTLSLDNADANANVQVQVSGGGQTITLSPPSDLNAEDDVFTAPDNTVLQPSTTYTVTVTATTGGTKARRAAKGTNPDSRSKPGFKLLEVDQQPLLFSAQGRNVGSRSDPEDHDIYTNANAWVHFPYNGTLRPLATSGPMMIRPKSTRTGSDSLT